MSLSSVGITKKKNQESGVSNLVEYLIITGIVLLLIIIIIPIVNFIFIENPANHLTSYAYNDIGNGVSTRIIDLYAIIPGSVNPATITTKFDVPDDVIGRDYYVEIISEPGGAQKDKYILISGNGISSKVSLAGIGASIFGESAGKTTASGVNTICYDWGGNCP